MRAVLGHFDLHADIGHQLAEQKLVFQLVLDDQNPVLRLSGRQSHDFAAPVRCGNQGLRLGRIL
ncbi:hypothetical protein [Methylomonas koyamae]|uniref:hypothetical protein n=1 Tax=Methylomonas koyamae TaxID=702114 RepID=UPI00210FF4D3|nr:hypothetical protein [Methylomonas koyamae]